MEGTLIGTWFKKMLDALKMGPTKSVRVSPGPPGSRKTDPFRVTTDGIVIRGRIFFPVAHPDRQYPVVVICHGIPGSGATRPAGDPGYGALAEEFTSLGLAAVVFNFRGCGDSEGDFSILGWTRDLDAVLDTVRNTPYIDPTRVIVLGFSGGGVAAVHVAAQTSGIFAVAIAGTPADFKLFDRDPLDIVTDFQGRGIIRDPDFPRDVSAWLKEFETVEARHWVAHFKGKHLLVVHGDADELIPVDHAHDLAEHAPRGVSEVSIIPGGEHRLRLDPRCVQILKEWFLKILGWKASAVS